MLNLKINTSSLNLNFCLLIFQINIFCSSSNIKENELIQLSPIQKSNIYKMLDEIYPNYKLETYLIDPNNINTCYLFIENTYTKQITHFTIFLNDEKSLQLVKNKILYNTVLINNIFNECLKDEINIENEIYKIKSMLIQFDIAKFNNILNRIFHNFFKLLHCVNKNNIVKFRFNNNNELYGNKKISYILNNLNTILLIGFKIRELNLSFLNQSSYNFVDMHNLEIFLSDKMYNYKNFTNFSNEIKFYLVNKLSKYAYFFCNRRKICTNHVTKYILIKIRLIENKSNKYTIMLCFVKIFREVYNFKLKTRILKLMIIILLHLKKYLNRINCEESLILLSNISKKYNSKRNKSLYTNKMDFMVDNIKCSDLKNILIYQYIFLIFPSKDIKIFDIDNLSLYLHYYELIWLIIKCCIISTYNIFNIDL
ncbi:hypothetical protein NAPIS_ORF00333 [Vairimorpha apis BRL 01]|uniref:Uncharacterized protein n=1 Tax=Vairimorpha apis BRL 01 TaxID=1037528 RepID=T0LCQ4_9MICR|nr:hypothetical protein NAPIS_ORF00333 [Vairimorpha apis BRL 01]